MRTTYDTAEERDLEFNLRINADGTWPADKIQIAVLCDIRRELKKLNRLLHCPNFTTTPTTLRLIQRNTTKRRKKK